MAGLAGASLSVGIAGTFIENMTAGRGFIALAIVTSGRWSAWGCLFAAVIFGFVEQLQFLGQAQGWRLPYQLFLALPYVVTLLILIGGGKQGQAPASLGRPYRRI
jgi:simple sugar transport system permease protein